MLKKSFLLLPIAIAFIISNCTKIVYDNPLDINGTNQNIIQQNTDSFEDENKDGIPNIVDRTWSKYPKDGKAPVITLYGGDTVEIQKYDNDKVLVFKDVSNKSLITAKDPEGGNVLIEVIKDSVDVYTINNKNSPYYIIYKATDSSGNFSTATRYINIVEQPTVDTIPPSIQIGDSVIYLNVGNTFEDPGTYAYDIGDGAEAVVTVSGTVNTAQEGTYTITYTAKDSHGNTKTVSRKVIVTKVTGTDLNPPKIILKGADTLKLAKDQSIVEFKAAYVEPGYTATDIEDGDLTSKVTVSEILQQSNAYYYIKYDVKDKAGNSAQTVRRMIQTGATIEQSFPPVIVLVYGDSVIQHIKGTKWVEPGFAVTDVQDGTIPNSKVIVDSSNLVTNLGTLGSYQVTYTVTNSVNLTTVKVRRVQVVLSGNDRDKPVITLLGRNPDTVLVQSKEYIDPGYTALDDRDGDVTSAVQISGTIDLTRLGVNSRSYTVSDKAGNKATASRKVWVVPDTLTTDLLVRYVVPSPDSLPSVSGIYTTFNVDGAGPDLQASTITKIEFKWINEPNNKQFQFYITYSATPNFLTLSSITKNFTTKPQMTLAGTTIDGLDGKYYVTTKGNTLIWVKTDGSFAILLTK